MTEIIQAQARVSQKEKVSRQQLSGYFPGGDSFAHSNQCLSITLFRHKDPVPELRESGWPGWKTELVTNS